MNKGRETPGKGAAASRPQTNSNGAPDPGALYVITLAASVAPLPMRAPKASELAGLAVFRSRQLEDGRERFRLHIGFFACEADAEQLLPLVRVSYPGAIVAPAPEGSMGSLDDTGVARFSILRPAAKPAAPSAAVAKAASAAPARAAPSPALSAAAAAALQPESPRKRAPALRSVPTPPPAARPVARAAVVRPSPPNVARAPNFRGIAPSDVEMQRAEAAGLLGTPQAPTFNGSIEPPVLSRAEVALPEPVEEAAQRDTQHYAVQLIWNRGAIELDKIPVLAIFNGYLLYAVESDPGPRRCCGVRLGFYADALSARLVAQYVRSEFKGVSVVPVSPREMTRASTAAIRLGASRRGGSSSITRSRWPASPLAVDPANLRRAFTPGVS